MEMVVLFLNLLNQINMYKIEKNVPLPANPHGRSFGRKLLYPFNDMEIEDSFLVTSDSENFNKKRHNIAALCSSYGKKNNKQFTSIGNELDFTIRVWRVK